MLNWTKQTDGWYANGYVIRLVEPFHWVLTANDANDAAPEVAAVSIPTVPLATGRTLTECKREAELIEARHMRAAFYRRHAMLFLISSSMVVLVMGAAAPWGLLLSVPPAGLALAALARMTGFAFSRSSFRYHDVFYQ